MFPGWLGLEYQIHPVRIVSSVVSDCLGDPVEVARDFGVDAVLPLSPATFPVAGHPVQIIFTIPLRLGLTEKWTPTVPRAGVCPPALKPRANLTGRDVVLKDFPALLMPDDRNSRLLQRVRPVLMGVFNFSPAHDGAELFVLGLELQAGQTGVPGLGVRRGWVAELDEGDVVGDGLIVEVRMSELPLRPDVFLGRFIFLKYFFFKFYFQHINKLPRTQFNRVGGCKNGR